MAINVYHCVFYVKKFPFLNFIYFHSFGNPIMPNAALQVMNTLTFVIQAQGNVTFFLQALCWTVFRMHSVFLFPGVLVVICLLLILVFFTYCLLLLLLVNFCCFCLLFYFCSCLLPFISVIVCYCLLLLLLRTPVVVCDCFCFLISYYSM